MGTHLRTAIATAVLCAIQGCTSLSLTNVSAPAINCKFDSDCTITVADSKDHFTLAATSGDAFLQSRTYPPGEAGSAAQGLHAYLYRLDLRQLAGVTALPCVNRLKVDFGPVVRLDYNNDNVLDDVFVVTGGGLGSVTPSAASQSGRMVTFTFNPPVCAGSGPGAGESSFFFGMTSATPPRPVVSEIRDTLGDTQNLDARAPDL